MVVSMCFLVCFRLAKLCFFFDSWCFFCFFFVFFLCLSFWKVLECFGKFWNVMESLSHMGRIWVAYWSHVGLVVLGWFWGGFGVAEAGVGGSCLA